MNESLNIHRETDVLGLARATKKRDYWVKVVGGDLPIPTGQDIEYAKERLEYWIDQCFKYEERIQKHISDFKKIKDPLSFLAWIAGVVDTIKSIINLITK